MQTSESEEPVVYRGRKTPLKDDRRTFYPWESMDIGDEFEIGIENPKGYNHVRQLVYAANVKQDKLDTGVRFAWRRDAERRFVRRVA